MNIGLAGPVTLRMLQSHVDDGAALPQGYQFPLTALWVQELLARGHRVWLYTLAPELDTPRTFAGPNLSIRIGRQRQRARHRALDFFAAERHDLESMMREDPCDIVHANWTYEFALAALNCGKPTLVTAHDAPFQVLRYIPNAYRAIRLLMALRVAQCAPRMTAVSSDVAAHFTRFLRYRGPIDVIPNFLYREVFAFYRPRKQESARLTFASALTGWGRLKNSTTVLESFAEVRRMLPHAHLLMFGPDFQLEGPAHSWARERGLDRQVEFIGPLPHAELLRRLSSEADILVHPSFVEALSVTVMEAMAVGLPIVAGERTGGMSYLLEDGKAGILVDVGSRNELADAMVRLGTDAKLRKQLGSAAHRSALRRLHADVVIPQYEIIYERMMQSAAAC